MIKSSLIMISILGLLTGSAVASDLMASVDHAKHSNFSTDRTTHSDIVPIPIQPEALIKKANVSPSDADITVQVLKILKRLNALDVAVVSNKGKVTLIGFVPSFQDRDQIVDLVEEVEGVKEIETEALAAG